MPEVQSDLVNQKNAAGRFKRTPGRSRFRRHSIQKILASLVLLAVLAIACGTPTLPCGTFSFTGAPHANRGVNVSVTFNFNAATCGAAACNCNTICYIQIVRIIDRDTGNFLAPSTEQQNRIVTTGTPTQNGWAVDRIDNRKWGYYARFDSGTFDTYLTTGSNTTPAILNDSPSGWPNNSWFDAVSVPVCIDAAAACKNRLEGYYYWLFIVDNTGTAGAPFNEVGVTWMQDSFNLAVAEWNTDAPGLGKNNFPAMSPLP
jgi:hypothetical protein